MTFLPENYKIPQQSNYTKFEQGETLIRILAQPILGFELWVENKPRRYQMEEKIPMSDLNKADKRLDGSFQTPRHFWAMIIWNYNQECLQIMEITQKTIMNKVKDLSRSKNWGEPQDYDLSITKTGEKLQTEYSVMPNPKAEVSKEIEKAFKESKINVEALYTGDDPFKSSEVEVEIDTTSDSVIPF